MRKAGFTRVKIYDNESMTMIRAKKFLKMDISKQRYKIWRKEIIESKLRAELPKVLSQQIERKKIIMKAILLLIIIAVLLVIGGYSSDICSTKWRKRKRTF